MAQDSHATSSGFRSLLPASQPSTADAEPGSAGPIRSTIELTKRLSVTTACGACRKLKARCSGERPVCSTCNKRRTRCEYDRDIDETHAKAVKRKFEEIQNHRTPYEHVYDALRSRPEGDVAAIIRKIRRGENVDDIARQVEHGDLLLQSSLVPETRYRYEFPFSSNMPPYLISSSNMYLDSLIYEWAPPVALSSQEARSDEPFGRRQPSAEVAEYYIPYLKPYHAAEIVDAQLSAVVPSKWTTVCSDDVLMTRLLSAYFLQDHDWWTAFQKDCFLEDMSKMNHDLCSALLVNAVLASSCNYYRGLSDRTEFWNPQILGYRFLAEARRLWEYEQGLGKLTTIQAALVMNIIYSGSGADKIGVAYMVQACELAHKIGLFNLAAAVNDPRLQHARDYTAWALFCWQRQKSYMFSLFPAANRHGTARSAVAGPGARCTMVWRNLAQIPLSRTLCPSASGDVFKARAEFALILNELAKYLFAGTPPTTPLSAVAVANFYFRFKGWYDSLPASLGPRRAVLPVHLKIHMHYFQIINRLIRSPSVLGESGSEHQVTMANLFGQPPQQILANSKASLETLLRAYYLRHGFEWLDTYLVSVLMEMCLDAIDSLKDDAASKEVSALRSRIILFAKGIYEQGQNFFLGKLVFQLVQAKMRREDLDMLGQVARLEGIGERQAFGLKQVQMEWPVNIMSMADDPQTKKLGDMVDQLAGTSLE